MAVSLVFVLVSGFITAGLIFAMVKRRQGAGNYVLFWQNPFGARGRQFIKHSTFQGTAAELSRIFLFAAVTLMSALSLVEALRN